MNAYLGIDVGSVSTNVTLMNDVCEIIDALYIRTQGRPIAAVQQGIAQIGQRNADLVVQGVGVTGSGRQLAGAIVGADSIKNEITAHAVAAMHLQPDVQTVLEIGGQDSKIIIIRNGVVTDFAMNTVCAAGTGSFLDQQAARLNIPVEQFGALALTSSTPVRIAGRCAVFAESDMIHKQQTGHSLADIIHGLCQSLVRNYLNNVGKGKQISGSVLFQGGVAANQGMKKAFEEALGCEIIVPVHYGVMGAVGAGLLAYEETGGGKKTSFRGFGAIDNAYVPRSFECADCPNRCEVIELRLDDAVIGCWGDRCGKWNDSAVIVDAAVDKGMTKQ